MYVGRDMTELSMTAKQNWKDSELQYFHHALQQIMPYLNVEGATIHREIVKEIEARGGLMRTEATWTNGTRVTYD
ncbi:cytosolic protein [Bacillus solimangrovi]|uniref:Cytosolic protein n=1 Tax=Bacillus solimangrovi TaxID=1305675 RepID=A0A1E5LBE0_9BACI|nr:cytosolic protein [Bacillus solimangrovi]OEH91393.1 cytosolic protein [Bacillus solimangrovi]